MFNRAISGVFPPGSTFKIISSVAGLESGKMPKDKTIEDTGVIKIGEFSFANWFFSEYGGKDGLVDMTKAIARSNDIYFYKLGETVGISTLASWGKKLGLGSRTGLELPSEAEGLMPDPVYKQKVRHEDWYTGDSYHVAIGQGDVQATPLQVNRWTSVIANGGKLCNYTLLQLTGSGTHCQNLGLKKDTIDTVTEGMRRACVSSGPWGYQGTGYQLFDFTVTHEELTSDAGSGISRKVPVACKTGTAEIGDADSSTHAWFTVFAPLPQNSDTSKKDTISGDPEIAVTVLVEKGGQGSVVAAPVAKKILEEYFKR
jgi:penicillin-binding protein 2